MKACAPISVALSGRLVSFSDVHLAKAYDDIFVSPLGSDVRARFVQPVKADSPISVSPLGSDVRARLVQLAKE